MKSLCLISSLLVCGIASAQAPAPRAVRGAAQERPHISAMSTQLYLTSTIAGMGLSPGYTGDGASALAAQLANPLAIAVDAQGDYFISDSGNHVIREVVAATGNIVTVAGNGTPGFSGDGGPATSAQFSVAHSIAVDGAGNLYIADGPNARVRVVNSAGVISTFAGDGTLSWSGDGGLAVNASLFYPTGVAVDPVGNVFIADYGNGTVRMVSAATGIISTVAGYGINGFGNFPGDNGPAFQDLLGYPYAITVDESGNVFFSDVGSGSIRKVGRDGYIHTIVSNVATASLTTDPAGNLYYADYRNNVIDKLVPGGAPVVIAGTSGTGSYAGDGGPGAVAQFNEPYSIALDSSANIYVADYANDVIRKLVPVAAPNAIVVNGASDQYLPVAPGELVSVFGNNIGFSIQATSQANANGVFPTQFAGTTVTFNGIPAPILVSGPTFVSVVVPYELTGVTAANVVVMQGGQVTGTGSVPVAEVSPGIFTAHSTGVFGLSVLNSDLTPNTTTNAAAESSTITLFVTGEGQTSPGGIDGLVSGASNTPTPLQAVTATVGGNAATVTSAAEAPGQIAGVLQVSLTLPSAVTTSSNVLVQVQVGSALSQQVSIAVQ